MTDIVHAGPLAVRYATLVMALAALAAYGLIRWKCPPRLRTRAPMPEWVLNAAVWGILVWKASPIALHPGRLIDRPVQLLLTPGGTIGLWAGSVVAIGYLGWKWLRAPDARLPILDLAACGLAAYWFVTALLLRDYGKMTSMPWGISLTGSAIGYHPLHAYRLLWLVPLLLWLLLRPSGSIGDGKAWTVVLIAGGAGWMAVSLFAGAAPLPVGLTGSQLIYLGMMLGGLLPWSRIAAGTS